MILKNIYKILVWLLIVFIVYIQHNAQNSVGGGFQAGFIAACSLILYFLAYNKSMSLWLLQKIAALGVLIYFVVGAYGIKEHGIFLDYRGFSAFFGQAGPKLAITLIELGIALTVFASVTMIYLALREHDQ
jgi:multisubunit Na+/H+ antiporter MnhB subunit